MKKSAITFKRWLLDNHQDGDAITGDVKNIINRFDSLDSATRANFIEYYCFCMDHTDKMRGVISISTERSANPFCKTRRENATPDDICYYCFVERLAKQYKALTRKLTINTVILCGCDLSAEDVPVFDPSKYPLLRFEAFGDLMSVQQAKNYHTIAKYNPGIKCALWTKNPNIWAQAVKLYNLEQLDNLSLVLSSPKTNKPDYKKFMQFEQFNKLFTVYQDLDTAAAKGSIINCGARSCFNCRRCYNLENEFVNELIK